MKAFIRFVLPWILLWLLLSVFAILIDERCAGNEAEREAVSVEKLVTESRAIHRLPKED